VVEENDVANAENLCRLRQLARSYVVKQFARVPRTVPALESRTLHALGRRSVPAVVICIAATALRTVFAMCEAEERDSDATGGAASQQAAARKRLVIGVREDRQERRSAQIIR
jgi:hypothetical protein